MDYKMQELKKNGEGYNDPTAYEAIKNVDPTARKRYRLIGAISEFVSLLGMKLSEELSFVTFGLVRFISKGGVIFIGCTL